MDWVTLIGTVGGLVPPQYQHAWITIVALVGAFGVIVKALDGMAQVCHAKFPNSRFWTVAEHILSYLAPRWPKLPPPASPLPAKLAAGGSVSKALVLAVLLGAAASARAQVTWSNPDVTFGAVAALAEVNAKTGDTGVGTGFGVTLEVGQFNLLGHSWSAFDFSLDILGGALFPGNTPVGQLQLGGCLGTFNGIANGCVFTTPWASNGGGWSQGGSPGATFAGMINIPALVAAFGGSSATSSTFHAPRGGFGTGG